MAYGNGGNYDPNTKLVSLTLKDKDLPAPHFEVQVKEGDKYVASGTATRISGDLIGIRHKENEYQGKKIKSVTITIKDDAAKEVDFVNVPYTYLGRNIINSLANLTSYAGIEISVYKGKPKTEGKPGFSSCAIRQAGNLIYGKVEYKNLPAIPKVKVGDQFYADATAIDAFFQQMVEDLATQIKVKSPVVANESHAPQGVVAAPAGEEEDDSGLPF